MRNTFQFKVGTGITSILMIFVVLCLTAFGVLSYSAAKADLNLSEKHVENIENYYAAESIAVTLLSRVDTIVAGARSENLQGSEYYENISAGLEESIGADAYNEADKTVTISQRVNDRQTLRMIVSILPETEEERCVVKALKVDTETGSYEAETFDFE